MESHRICRLLQYLQSFLLLLCNVFYLKRERICPLVSDQVVLHSLPKKYHLYYSFRQVIHIFVLSSAAFFCFVLHCMFGKISPSQGQHVRFV